MQAAGSHRSHHSRRAEAETATASAQSACLRWLTEAYGPLGSAGPALQRAFSDTRAAYWGDWPAYLPCDTPYHDLGHALATAEMAAQLVARHARHDPAHALDAPHAALTVVLALLHDTGFLRRKDEPACAGATLTREHETRSIAFVDAYLPGTPWASLAPRTTTILGTRLGTTAADLSGDDVDELIFGIVGTADLLAQIADPLYLERCRDFLYAEFAIAGLDVDITADGRRLCRYRDGTDLLRQTGAFVRGLALPRLDTTFSGLWRLLDTAEGGRGPISAAIAHNLARLDAAEAANDWAMIAGQPLPLLP